MYVVRAGPAPRAGRAGDLHRRRRATRAPLPGDSRVPARLASSSSTMAPTLCRFPAYPGPGLPSPTTRNGPLGRIRAFFFLGRHRRGAGSAGAPGQSVLGQRETAQDSSSGAGGGLGRSGLLALGSRLGLPLVRLLALDAGLGLGLVELGLERLGGRGADEVDDQRVGSVTRVRRWAATGRRRRSLARPAAGDVDLDRSGSSWRPPRSRRCSARCFPIRCRARFRRR